MKKKLLSFLLALSIFSVGSLYTYKDSHALVGLLFRSKSLRSFGSITAGVSATTSLVGFASIIPLAATFPGSSAPFYALAAMFYGAYAAVFGLVILDDNTVVGLDYLPITEFHPDFKNYTQAEIDIYNSEIDELNAIKNTLDEELKDANNFKELGPRLWQEYSNSLHPTTVKIAQDQAVKLLKNLSK